MSDFAIVTFDRDNSAHDAFLFKAVAMRAGWWPYVADDERWLRDTVRRAVVSNPRGCLLAVDPDDDDLFYGAVVTMPGEVVFAYTKDILRGPGNFDAPPAPDRHLGVCSTLLTAAGIDLSKPTPVRIWSDNASKIAARGYHIFPSIAR